MKTYELKNNDYLELCSLIKEFEKFLRAINKISLINKMDTSGKIKDFIETNLCMLHELEIEERGKTIKALGKKDSPEIITYSSVEDLVNKIF